MPAGKGIYDEQHRDDERRAKGDPVDKPDRAKKVPEDTPDVDTGEGVQEPPD